MKRLVILLFAVLLPVSVGNAQWAQLPGSGSAKAIATDPVTGTIWVVGSNDGIFHFTGTSWYEYPGGGRAIDIAAYDGIPYVIGTDQAIYKGNTRGWDPVGGSGLGKRISVSPMGTLWVIGTNDGIFYLQGANQPSATRWVEYPGGGRARDLAIMGETPYVIGTDGQIYGGSGTGWSLLPGSGLGKDIFVAAGNPGGGRLWVTGSDDRIFYYQNNTWHEYPGSGLATDIAVFNNIPYVIGTDTAIWKGQGSY